MRRPQNIYNRAHDAVSKRKSRGPVTDAERLIQLERHIRQLRRGYVPVIIAAVAAFGLSFHGNALNTSTLKALRTDEHSTKVSTVHTREVQKAGEPTGVCLREAMKAGLPILIKGANSLEEQGSKAPPKSRAQFQLFVGLARSVERPLKEYVKLQEHRYDGTTCPIPKKTKRVRPRA